MKRTFKFYIGDKAKKMPYFEVGHDKDISDYGCPICRRSSDKLKPVTDITQYGFEYDKVVTVFYCKKCKQYVAVSYLLWAHWTKTVDTEVVLLESPF